MPNDLPPMLRPVSRWKTNPVLAGAPPGLRPWLTDPGSLTAHIVSRCRHFRVSVLTERRGHPSLDEAALIGLTMGRYAWLREVLLIADETPVVFAHSVLALRDLTGAWHMARAIGSRPLGAALFADPCIAREGLVIARLGPAHPLHRRASEAVGMALPALWARRSRFLRRGRPLLVTEVFLPAIARL
ncbi:MAG: chorismate lyase [Rhodocyclaceae bacterium]|nr:chorismate lyase [Rhodocyclaceae bacterium]